VKRVATGEPFDGMISGRLPLVWARAQLICDSPDKKNVENGAMVGRLMQRAVANATDALLFVKWRSASGRFRVFAG
jgi:putative cardiolipin synthase